jgi:hypothetical protein
MEVLALALALINVLGMALNVIEVLIFPEVVALKLGVPASLILLSNEVLLVVERSILPNKRMEVLALALALINVLGLVINVIEVFKLPELFVLKFEEVLKTIVLPSIGGVTKLLKLTEAYIGLPGTISSGAGTAVSTRASASKRILVSNSPLVLVLVVLVLSNSISALRAIVINAAVLLVALVTLKAPTVVEDT